MDLSKTSLNFAVFGALKPGIFTVSGQKLILGRIFDGNKKKYPSFKFGDRNFLYSCSVCELNHSSISKNQELIVNCLHNVDVLIVVLDMSWDLQQQKYLTRKFLTDYKISSPKILAAVSFEPKQKFDILDVFYHEHDFDEMTLITNRSKIGEQILIAAYRVSSLLKSDKSRQNKDDVGSTEKYSSKRPISDYSVN